MTDSTFTFRVDEDLKAAFAAAARAEDRTAAQFLRVLMREAVQGHESRARDDWFREQVEQGVREADDPDIPRIAHAEVRAGWDRMRKNLKTRDASETT